MNKYPSISDSAGMIIRSFIVFQCSAMIILKNMKTTVAVAAYGQIDTRAVCAIADPEPKGSSAGFDVFFSSFTQTLLSCLKERTQEIVRHTSSIRRDICGHRHAGRQIHPVAIDPHAVGGDLHPHREDQLLVLGCLDII